MSAIGPFSGFDTMQGRLLTAVAPMLPSRGGMRAGKRRPRPSTLRTTETHASAVDAWVQAWYYRSAIGGITSVVDDGGLLCDCALVNDVRTTVRALAGGEHILETAWLIVPAVTFGDYGEATQYLTVDTQNLRQVTQPARPVTSSSAISVGGIAFTTATGDLQWPISGEQAASVMRAAKAIGADEVVREPAPSSGTLSCAVGSASETTAFDLMRNVRAIVGTYADVLLGGVTIPAVAIADVRVDWRTVVGMPGGDTRLVTVEWDCDTQDETGGDQTATVALVQVAHTFGVWQTVKGALCYEASEGVNGLAGSVTWELPVGKTLRGRKVITADPTDYSGKWCRIVYRTNENGDPDPRGTQLVPAWHGVVMSTEITGGGGKSATMQAVCHGLSAAMDQMFLSRWYEVGLAGATADPGEILPINDQPGGNGGGAGTGDVNGFTVHDRAKAAPKRWKALELAQTLIRAYSIEYPLGPTFVLGGQTTSLDIPIQCDLRGKSFFKQLAEIISPKRNLVYRLEVEGALVTIRMQSTLSADLTVGATTQAASTRMIPELDLTGDDVDFQVRRDRSQQCDRGLFEGGRTWIAATFAFGTGSFPANRENQLAKGWDSALESTWNAADAKARESGELGQVWRRFKLRDDFNGKSYYGGVAGSVDLLKMSRAVDGDGAETGALQVGGTQVKAANLRFSRTLPVWKGHNWHTITGSSDVAEYPKDQLEGPLLFGLKVSDNTYEVLTNKWDITIEDDGAAVILGRNAEDAEEIRKYLATGRVLLFTLGIFHPLPWRYSWKRALADRPRDQERVTLRQYPDIAYRYIVGSTLMGLTNSTTLQQAPADPVLIDWDIGPNDQRENTSRLEAEKIVGRKWQEDVVVGLHWTERGIVDVTEATAPTYLVQSAVMALDDTRTYTETVNAIITGRSWNFKVGEIATSWAAERIMPGFERLILANTAPQAIGGIGRWGYA